MSRPHLDDVAFRQIKLATKALLLGCGGGEAASAACRLGPSHLSEAGSIYHRDRFLPLDVVVALERASEAMPVTATLARLQGCVLVPVEPRQGGDLAALLAHLGREVGGVFAASALALADGHVDDAERADLSAALGDLVAAAHAAIAALAPAPVEVPAVLRRA